MYNTLAVVWALFNFSLAVISFGKIKKDLQKLDFIYKFAAVTGAFVWEDMFVFGLLHTAGIIIGFLSGDLRISLLLFLIFWIVRSAGETLYFFLQQFIQPKHHPHDINTLFKPIRWIFGNISEQKCFILLQITYQTILVFSLFGLVLLLTHRA